MSDALSNEPLDAGDRPAAPPEPTRPPAAGGAPVAWKAAASSIPRLRQQPVVATDPRAEEPLPGPARDAWASRSPAATGERGPRSGEEALAGPPEVATPLAEDPPFWEIWADHLRSLPRPLWLGAAALLVVGVVAVLLLRPREGPSVPLARLRQQPEAFDGRLVRVRGRAGETFEIGGSYVFNLRQGRDTIVVYSRTRRPAPNEAVQATGTVSIGYLDGIPRVALLEIPRTP